MICPHCQFENVPNAAFCDECGAKLETACPHCGEANRRAAKFCKNCGQAINQTQPSVPTRTAPAPAPDTYVPKHLAAKIRASRQALEGERKQVTVLFADIRGSTKLLEGLDPEDAQTIIDPVLHVMMEAVHRYEGTVNQVLGDGIMALFGAPLAHEDHALRACYAALAMQEQMHRHREKLKQSEELGLQIGIGLNSGEVVVRSIDNDLNLDYSALGHATHLAARMQELAGGSSIILTAATLREVEGFVDVKSLGPVQTKGISRPVDAYQLIGATTARTRLHASVARGLTPFVGRKTEIEIFQKLIAQSAAGRGQVLAMVGEPGMGKSRLVYEFIHYHLPPDWLVLEGSSVSYGKATPYFPLIELLRRYFAIGERDVGESIQDKVVMHVLELDSSLKDTIAPILSLLGASSDQTTGPLPGQQNWMGQMPDVIEAVKRFNDMEPQQRRRYTLDALKRLFIREGQRQSLLLVFEDLHWIDNETQAFLDSLLDSLPMARILLVVNYRPGYTHTWSDKTYYTQLRVDPLQATNAEELLQNLLGANKDLAPLRELLIERTEGNPFFAEESIRSLVETGVLTGQKGAYRPGLAINNIRLPSKVQNIVADRIDRLPIEEKHLLQTAAVIGVIVPFPLLQAVADLPEAELYQGLSNLRAAEFLYETNLFPEVEYSFKHALTNEVAYGALLHDRRTLLHAKIVKALEQMTENTSHDHLEKLAHHAFLGEIWDKAVSYLGKAASKALASSANQEAVVFLETALDALRRLPQDLEAFAIAVDLRLELRNALFLLGEFGKIPVNLAEAQAAAEALNDGSRLRRVWNAQLSYYSLTGQPERVIEFGQRALAPTMACADTGLDVVTYYYMGIAHHVMGDYRLAMDVLNRAMAALDHGNLKYERFGTSNIISVSCRNWLVQSLAQIGSFGEGAAVARDGIEIAQEANHPYSFAYISCSLGFLLLLKGDFETAIQVLERCEKFCRDSNIRVLVPQTAAYLGYARALAGNMDEALPLLNKADEQTLSIGRTSCQALRVSWHGESYLLSGRPMETMRIANWALELSNKHNERGHGAWALKLMGDATSHGDTIDSGEARSCYDRALALADELGMRPLQAHCHYGLGNLYLKTSQPEQGRDELRAAIDLYRQMDMKFWLAKAERARSEAR